MQNAELDIMLIGQMFLEGAKFAQVHVRTDSRFRYTPVTLSSQSITLDLPFLRVAAVQRH